RMIRRDRVNDLWHFPRQIGLDHRILNDLVALPLEPTLALWGSHRFQVPALAIGTGCVGRRPRSPKGGAIADRAVAVDALNFDGGAHFALQPGVAVVVLYEMAIDAVHTSLQMNVHVMNRYAGLRVPLLWR